MRQEALGACIRKCYAHLRCWVDRKLELGLLAVVHRQPLHEERGEARSSSATEGVEDQEALETGAHIGNFANAVKN